MRRTALLRLRHGGCLVACPPAARHGFTLIEMLVVLSVLSVMVSMCVPSFTRFIERSRMDIAAANLRSIWSAEQFYWLEYRAYTSDLQKLGSLGLIEKSLATSQQPYSYSISSASGGVFVATATRQSGGKWQGQLSIDQTGATSGSVAAPGQVPLVLKID